MQELETKNLTVIELERTRRQWEQELCDAQSRLDDLQIQHEHTCMLKRKADSEILALAADLEECNVNARAAEERAQKAGGDAARLADELRQEQEHGLHTERMRKALEQQIKEMQGRLDEAEQIALKGGKRALQKLEGRIRELEQEIEQERIRSQDNDKNYRRSERRVKELEFAIDESKKNADRQTDLIDKLQSKLKTYKRQIDETDELAQSQLSKYRLLQAQLEEAEERVSQAENALSKTRLRAHSTLMTGARGGLMTSASSANIGRSSSRSGIVSNTTWSSTVQRRERSEKDDQF